MADKPATDLVVPETKAATIVFAPATGACPLLLLLDNVSDGLPYITTYPVEVAPDEGNEAANHVKITSFPDIGLSVN